MNDEIDLTANGRLQGQLVRVEEILSPAMPIGARTEGKVESEMRVGDEQDADRRSGHDRDRTGARRSRPRNGEHSEEKKRRALPVVEQRTACARRGYNRHVKRTDRSAYQTRRTTRLIELRDNGTIGDAAFQRVEQELDLRELDVLEAAPT